MADLHNDIIGQVARLPLKPSEASSLLPLYEAISNALHAITDRFGDTDFAEKGRIDIEVLRGERKEGDEDADVIGFVIKDNGVGLNEENFQSFCTPFSRHKIRRGGKGVGRLGWLKVFDRIEIASRYQNGTQLKAIEFAFVLREHNQIDLKDAPPIAHEEPGTTIRMSGFRDSYGTRCPAKTDTILQRIIGHFLPVFAGNKSPRIFLHDDAVIDVRDQFHGKIRASLESTISVEIEGESHQIVVRHMRCDKSIRPRGQNYNWVCFCAHDRGVKEFAIDDQLGLHKLDNEEIYVGAVTGEYLDSHVNPQRTDFIFDAEEGKLIRRQVADSIRDFLKDPIEQMLAHKKEVTTEVIKKNPQYMYLSGELDEFVSSLKPNATSEEQIYVEMAQHKYRRQRKFNIVKKDIDRAPNYSGAIAQKIDEYRKYILDDKKGTLAEYVTKRKAVLDLLDKMRGFTDDGTAEHHLEEAVHQLICPMRVDSNQLVIDDHNLWILDDRLAFFSFFASDLPIKSYTESASTREPDLALFYDSCVAWRESDRACDTIILVEFKRPGKDAYTDSTDPFMQLMDYISLFKTGRTVRDREGKVISGIGQNTAFQCYIVADLTQGLRKRLRGVFNHTPDGKGLFGYTRDPDAYVEVIPYDKLLLDAQARNAIFFDKLGLSG